ncbi:MAG: hypothetical protein LAQ30_14715 [Acidobacteriia bacterium]|nr:hypothetical protein [Terriglobia bacterium]
MLQSRISAALLTAALLTAALSMTVPALAQDRPQPAYHRTQCIKAEPGKMADLEQFALDAGHKGAMARANAGEFASALFLRSVLGGTEAPCDFVVVTIYNGFPPDPDSAMKLDAVLVAQDGFGRAEKGDYIRVDFMKPRPGQAEEWLKMERESFKPLHQARTEQGFLRGWTVATLAYPSGTSLPYTGATVNIMPDWKAVGNPGGGYAEAFKKAMPNAGMDAISEKVSETREIVRTELYRVIDMVGPMEKATRTRR